KHILPGRKIVLECDFDACLRRGSANVERRSERHADAGALYGVVDVSIGDWIVDAALFTRRCDVDVELAIDQIGGRILLPGSERVLAPVVEDADADHARRREIVFTR